MQVQGTILDVLKKKMRQTKEEMEKYKDECDLYQKQLQVEVMRREEVSVTFRLILLYFETFFLLHTLNIICFKIFGFQVVIYS